MRVRVAYKTNDQIKKSGASHIKIHFPLNEQLTFTSRFQVDKNGQEEWNINDKAAIKLVDKKDVFISLKRKKMLFGSETLEKKAIKLG